MAEVPKIRDKSQVNWAMFNADAEHTARRCDYLITRRDQLLDRLRFGILALNGASLIALMSMLGGSGSTAAWLGFNQSIARDSAIAFALGVVLAGISAMMDANLYRTEAADAEVRRSTVGRLTALYEADFTDDNYRTAGEVMKQYHDLPLVDFQFSKVAITLQNFAGGAWLFGIAVPLCSSLGWSVT